jgi:predicted mannosyl-3-phosphoglycerate phosphatase (HAD superfamily)
MIAKDYLRRIAAWSRELNERELEIARAGRRYDVMGLRDTRLAMMDRSTFFWLLENSVGFNRPW